MVKQLVSVDSLYILNYIYNKYINGDGLIVEDFTENFSQYKGSFIRACLYYLRDVGYIDFMDMMGNTNGICNFTNMSMTTDGLLKIENIEIDKRLRKLERHKPSKNR